MIIRQLRKEISEEEKTVLQNWLTESPANKKLYHKIIDQAHIKEKLKAYGKYNKQNAWKKIMKQIRKPGANRTVSLNKFLRYAAIFIPTLIGGYLFIHHTLTESNNQIVNTLSIETGTQKALLTLGNGIEIELKNSTEEVIISEQEADIIDVDNTLRYITTEVPGKTEVQEVYNTLETPRGGEYSIVLADGTKIWLNAASKLSYPVDFIGDKRKVQIEGEAYFEVAENRNKPFIVSSSEMEIEVLGTSFNVMSYKDEESILTTLVEGKVRVKMTDGGNRNLSSIGIIPGEQVVFKKEKNTLSSMQVDTDIYTAWKDGKFIVANETLEDLMRRLGRWYNFETDYSSSELRNYHFSGTLDRYSNISDLLELISLTTNLSFEIKSKTIIVKHKV